MSQAYFTSQDKVAINQETTEWTCCGVEWVLLSMQWTTLAV